MSRRQRFSAMGKAFTDDPELKARFVDIWRRPNNLQAGGPPMAAGEPCTPIAINDIAWELGIGQAKAAISMKHWEADGLVRRTNARTEQAEYEPTEKLLEMFPDGPQVMPEPERHTLDSGATVSGVSSSEIREWNQGMRIGVERRRAPGLVKPKQPVAGYLEKGDDGEAERT
jgi:hypothetical protein